MSLPPFSHLPLLGLASAATALGLAGCGTEPRATGEVRPPGLIQVSAVITSSGVTVSPTSFGAGPVVLRVANLTGAAQRVTFESAGRDGGFTQTTGPINPRGTAELKADVPRGRAVVRVDDEDVTQGSVTVGAERASAQDDLLQP